MTAPGTSTPGTSALELHGVTKRYGTGTGSGDQDRGCDSQSEASPGDRKRRLVRHNLFR